MTDMLVALADQARDHSIFAPSSSATWLQCPGSLIPAAQAPNDGNVYAAEGSVAHSVADTWLRSGERPSHLVGTRVKYDGYDIDITDGMLAYVQQYVEVCEATSGDHYYETKVDLSDLFPIPTRGTADFFGLSRGYCRVKDLKYGQGIKVFAKENSQGMLYAYGVFREWDWLYDFQTIEIEICQPRLDHFDKWECSRADLLAFADRVRLAARRAWAVDAPRSPAPKACEGCNRHVRKACPAYLSWFAALADSAADEVFGVGDMETAALRVPLIDLPALTLEQTARILPMRSAVEKWFTDLESRLFAHVYDNGPAYGYKVVEGRSNRIWQDADEAEARMREVGIRDPYNHSIKSPNQAAEQLHADTGMSKKKASDLFESHVERKPGALSLVKDDDRRQAITNGADFDTMIGDDL